MNLKFHLEFGFSKKYSEDKTIGVAHLNPYDILNLRRRQIFF